MTDQFNAFLDRISDASGDIALVEAVRNGYRVLTEGPDSGMHDVSGWTTKIDYITASLDRISYLRDGINVAVNYNEPSDEYKIIGVLVSVNLCCMSSLNVINHPRIRPLVGENMGKDGICRALSKIYEFATSGIDILWYLKEYYVNWLTARAVTKGELGGNYQLAMKYPDKYSTYQFSGRISKSYRPDITDRILRKYFGDDYRNRPVTDLINIDPVELYLYGARESGYDIKYMTWVLGWGLISDDVSARSEVFDRMAEEVRLDPLRYADDGEPGDRLLFRDYAKALITGDAE